MAPCGRGRWGGRAKRWMDGMAHTKPSGTARGMIDCCHVLSRCLAFGPSTAFITPDANPGMAYPWSSCSFHLHQLLQPMPSCRLPFGLAQGLLGNGSRPNVSRFSRSEIETDAPWRPHVQSPRQATYTNQRQKEWARKLPDTVSRGGLSLIAGEVCERAFWAFACVLIARIGELNLDHDAKRRQHY
jgi:hypothetical protein